MAPTGKMNPEVIGNTDRWFVVAKPAGWLTIPGRASNQGVSHPVLQEWAEAAHGAKLWVVHRIDLETSGVVLFAKTAESHRVANQWFEKHEVKKAYDFLAQGNPTSPIMKASDPIEGKPSVTQLEVKERFQGAYLGRATPLSGRRHQIRIHLLKKGHPILGDETYGGPKQIESLNLDIGRVALHAAKLELPGGERFEAPWPEDFQSWVEKLRSARQ
ncbi:MAG: RluA family pseudouridine synthase [Bdellovibrionia bacterium]